MTLDFSSMNVSCRLLKIYAGLNGSEIIIY